MRTSVLLATLLLAVSCAPEASTVSTTRSAVPEDINTRFLDPELAVDDWVARWEGESREIAIERDAIVDAVDLAPGEAIADVGAGTGLFVGPFSDAVATTGTVYALDIAPKFVEYIQDRAATEGITNVRAVLSEEASTTLPPGSVDVVFTCDTYHHFEYHEAMLHSIHTALRPGGRFIVIDFERIPGTSRDWILGHVRAGKEQVIDEIEDAGFRLDTEVEIDGLQENYFLRFVK